MKGQKGFKKGESGNKAGKPVGLKNRPKPETLIQSEILRTLMYGKHYVYYHKNNANGEIFYIGKGKNDRAWNRETRTDLWKSYTEEIDFDYSIGILACGLNNEDSLLIEAALIKTRNPKCNIMHSEINFKAA